MERAQIRWIGGTFEPGPRDRVIRKCQRLVGATWIHHCTKHLRQMHGLDRVPKFDPGKSYIVVSNHRSFFDLYVITGDMVHRGLEHRIVFPVRSEFFYDRALGFFVNGVMSFFAMYPPVFRDRERAALNLIGLDELAWLLRRGGVVVGLHPEGTRNLGDDPYAFLPAQSGVGRLIHKSRVEVIPVFINGLINDLKQQVWSNFDRSGRPIHVVFGEPVGFGELLDRPGSPRTYKAIAERCMEVVGALGQEEKRHRANGAADESTSAAAASRSV
jgi:1-acyl-sn-glycerol-3-phosphate acyltransferase